MISQPKNRLGRRGFTMVELLVAMALIVFIMYILAEAFSASAKTFRDLKAIGDLNAQLRSTTSLLRRYLAADHFEGRKRLSDYDFWKDGPPKQGFFRIWQDDGGFLEGPDLDGNPCYRTTTHHLHFTVRFRGNQRGDFFSATLPGGSPLLTSPRLGPRDSRFEDSPDQYHSQWAEVAIFLQPSGETTEDPDRPGGIPLPLHTLYLRQCLLVPSHEEVVAGGPAPPISAFNDYAEISVTRDPPNTRDNNATMHFNSPEDVTMPIRRFGSQYWVPAPGSGHAPNLPTLAGARSPGLQRVYRENNVNTPLPPYPALGGFNAGNDILLTDVISFDVRVLLDPAAYTGGRREEFISLHDPLMGKYWMQENNPVRPSNSDLAKIQPVNSVRVFDTWSSRKDDFYDYSGWASRDTDQTIPMYHNDASVDPNPIRIRAIQITLRIWDSRTKQSRQVSVIQDM